MRDVARWSRAATGSIVLGVLALACSAPRESAPPVLPARVEYRLRYDPRASDPVWSIEIRARGLADAKGLVLDLDDWGEWTNVDSYYVHALESDPPFHRVEGSRKTFAIEPPPGWNGDLRVAYELRTTELGSHARERHGLLPYRAETYSFGFSANTLMSVAWDGMPGDVERVIEIETPSDWTIATGFAGVSVGRQRAEIPASVVDT